MFNAPLFELLPEYEEWDDVGLIFLIVHKEEIQKEELQKGNVSVGQRVRAFADLILQHMPFSSPGPSKC